MDLNNFNETYKHVLAGDLFSKSIMVVLILSSVISWTIILGKWIGFSLKSSSNQKFKKKFLYKVKQEDEFDFSRKLMSSQMGKIYESGEEEIVHLRQKLGDRLNEYIERKGLDSIERELINSYESQRESLKSGMNLLGSISSVSVFIGLLGTVWGILNSFNKMSEGGGIDAIGPSIAEALVATALGLVVAIPASFFYNKFLKSIEKISIELKAFIRTYLNYIDRENF